MNSPVSLVCNRAEGASPLTRRSFLRLLGSSTLASPLLISASRLGAASPNGMLQHACIGVGGMGWGDLQNFLEHKKVRVVALCDVDKNPLDNAAKAAPGARLYSDWRELL